MSQRPKKKKKKKENDYEWGRWERVMAGVVSRSSIKIERRRRRRRNF